MIAPDYYESFKGYYDSEFVDMVGMAIDEYNFFPTIKNLSDLGRSRQRAHSDFVFDNPNEWENEPRVPMSEENKMLLKGLLDKIGEKI